ncbi:hypothetical protein BO71DRAFT_486531 [Aspergillus ellipticus CBS 707.79]|uniref:Uncharacterized protein n=1 Tax=Aspergillus ellipticus CBS 707.79 TaxID=1448320 RepID=A0A319D262_9EURO|nr:hypothetical protein BO71DRAFT_486531 [Aspergillus ellipticus CBS 707.79]
MPSGSVRAGPRPEGFSRPPHTTTVWTMDAPLCTVSLDPIIQHRILILLVIRMSYLKGNMKRRKRRPETTDRIFRLEANGESGNGTHGTGNTPESDEVVAGLGFQIPLV